MSRVVGLIVGAALVAAGLASSASAATFEADPATLGAVPDDEPVSTPRDVKFTVSGLTGAPTDVSIGLSVDMTYVLDLQVTLIAPDGTTKRTVFSDTGGGPVEDNSNTLGPYEFSDSAPASPSWWDAAAAINGGQVIPSGSYRASNSNAEANPGANALITPAFAGLTDPDGVWTLRFRDSTAGNTANVTAASLSITGAAEVPPEPPVTPDATAPETKIKRGPTYTGPKHSRFAFESSEPGSTFQCSLDKASFRDCKSPKDYRNLDKGKHVFRVVATDAAGNADATPATLKFKIRR